MRSDKLLRKQRKLRATCGAGVGQVGRTTDGKQKLDPTVERQLNILKAIEAINYPRLLEEEKSKLLAEASSQEYVTLKLF